MSTGIDREQTLVLRSTEVFQDEGLWTPWWTPSFFTSTNVGRLDERVYLTASAVPPFMTKTNVRLIISCVPVTKLVFFSFDFFRTGPQHREPKEGNLSAFGRAGSVSVRSGWFVCLLFFPDLDQ